MTTEQGYVTNVVIEESGSDTTQAASIGATVLTVEDGYAFNETGGQFTIDDGTAVYDYASADPDEDTITLSIPLDVAIPVETRILVYPPGETKWAMVEFDDNDEGCQALCGDYTDRMETGIREEEDQESVLVSDESGRWEIVAMDDEIPKIQGSYITGPVPTESLTDGEPPIEATVLTFIGGIGSVFFRWTEINNADPVTYRLHVRAGSAPATDGTYEVAAGMGLTAAGIRKLKDGTAIVSDGSVTYYGIVTVEDADGPGPASNTASGVPAQINTPDIAVGAITAGLLVANDALLEALQATTIDAVTITGSTITGSLTQTREEAQRGVKIGSVDSQEGLFVYNENGAVFLKAVPAEGMAVVAGEVKARSLTVSSDDPLVPAGASLGGVTEIASGSKILLTGGTTAPKSAPTATTGYTTVQFTADGDWGSRDGLGFDGTHYFTARHESANSPVFVEKWTAAGVLVDSVSIGRSTQELAGLAYHSGSVYVLSLSFGSNQWWVDRCSSSTLVKNFSGEWNQWDGNDKPAIGMDTGNGDILIAQSRPSQSDQIRIRRYTLPGSDGDLLVAGSQVNTDLSYNQDLAGIWYGAADFGANRYVISAVSAGFDYRPLNTSGTFQSDEYWASGSTSAKVGFTHDGSNFVAMTRSGVLRTFTNIWSTTVANRTKWVSNTLRTLTRSRSVTTTNGSNIVGAAKTGTFVATDVGGTITGAGIPAGATITGFTSSISVTISANATASATVTAVIGNDFETDQSPRSKIVMPQRSRLTVTTSPISSGTDADRVRIYVGQGTTDPGRTQMAKQTDPGAGVTTALFSTLTAPPGTNPPAANDFPGADGSTIEGPSGVFIKEDGSIPASVFRDAIDARIPAVRILEPYRKVNRDTNQAMDSSGWETVFWPNTDVDRGGISVGSGVFTLPKAGRYLVHAKIVWGASSTGRRALRIRHNNAVVNDVDQNALSTNTALGQQISHPVLAAANDTIDIQGWHNVASLNAESGSYAVVTYLGE